MKIKGLLFAVNFLCSAFAVSSPMVEINLSSQKLKVVDNNKTILRTSVSTGNIHHPTPKGAFKVFEKQRYHKSTLYPIRDDGTRGGAKMNYMLKFAPAIAIHEGDVKYENKKSIPVSHGCVRVPTKYAKKLFRIIKKGASVKVIGNPSYDDTFNVNLLNNFDDEDNPIYYSSDMYDGESNLNIAIATQDIEELE